MIINFHLPVVSLVSIVVTRCFTVDGPSGVFTDIEKEVTAVSVVAVDVKYTAVLRVPGDDGA